MNDLLIKNLDWVVTVDASRRLIRDGAILIQDGKIIAVDSAAHLAGAAARHVIDGAGRLAMPGLVDSTVAVAQHLGRGLGDYCDLPQYRYERVAPYEAALSEEDALWAARNCMLEMVRAGTTCFADAGSRYPEQIAAAAAEFGMRGWVGRACMDSFETSMGQYPGHYPRETLEQTVNAAAHTLERLRGAGHARIEACIALPWLTACSDELLSALAQLAQHEACRLIVGTCATRDEAVHSRVQYGKTEVERLQQAGLLGPRTLVSHAGWTSPDDLRILQRSGSSIVCCPSMSHRLGSGALEHGRFPELLAFGANVVLGSGSAMASNFTDLARQLYLFGGASKAFRLDATIVPPETTIEMATIGGATALGLDHRIGSLEVGKAADITLFKCRSVDWIPVINPLQNLVFSARGGADTTIVDGRVLLEHGSLSGFDQASLLDECQTRSEALMERAGLARHALPAWPIVQ